MKVLKLSAQGLPQSWISLEQAVLHYAADEVRWEMGARVVTFHGGHNEEATKVVNNIRGAHGFDKADGEYFADLLRGTIKDRKSVV